MTDSKTEKLSVQLNEAFARLEQEQKASNPAQIPATASKIIARSSKIDQSDNRGFGGILGILLALIAMGIASYGAYTSFQLKEAEGSDIDKLAEFERNIAAFDVRIEQLRQVSLGTEDLINVRIDAVVVSQLESIQGIQDQLNSSISEVKASLGTSSEDWLLAEAEYLIRLGTQRVIMEQDPKGAIALFQAADVIIRDAEGIVAFGLRKALAGDIARLKSVSDLDVDGLFVQITALIGQIDSLKQRQLKFKAEKISQPDIEPSGFTAQILSVLSNAGDRLMNLVDYRADGEVITPILPPQEAYYLRQNLVMKLQLAQLGLLRSDQQIFETSLAGTAEWINRHYDPEDVTTRAMLESISDIRLVDISQPMPEVSASLREVRMLLARFHNENNRGTEVEPGAEI